MATSGKPVGPILKGRVSQKNIPSWDIIYDGKIGETGRLDLAKWNEMKWAVPKKTGKFCLKIELTNFQVELSAKAKQNRQGTKWRAVLITETEKCKVLKFIQAI